MKNRIRWEDIVLWQDDDFALINKPPGISTLEDRNSPVNILALAKAAIGDAQVCHRLDKETSGVLAVAKNPEAYRHLCIQFEKRQVSKIYHAVVDGVHNFDNELVDQAIVKLEDGTVRINNREGKTAQTHFTSLTAYRDHTLLECRPVTGRMHQIRIHLTVLNAPITGDLTYGGKPFFLSSVKRKFNLKKLTDEEPLIKRMALHAFALEFRDLKENIQHVEAPYPKDIQALVRQLSLND